MLLTAMESAPAALYYLTDGLRLVWANARARGLGTGADQLPVIDGCPVADVVAEVLPTGLPQMREPESPPSQPAAAAVVHVDRAGPFPVVRVSGAVDAPSAQQLRIRLLEASHGGAVRTELDLVGGSLFSSAAVREVLGLARIARDEQWRLVVHATDGSLVRHILETSGLADLVDLR